MRSLSEINTRLQQLKSRQKDGVDVSEEIEPLEFGIYAIEKYPIESIENEIKLYIKECIDNDQYKRASSAIWLLNK